MSTQREAIEPMPQRDIKQSPVIVLEDEFAQEKASALGRLGRALESALAALARFDTDHGDEMPSPERRQARAALVAEASLALWNLVVQREACGLRDTRYVLRDYRVPAEVAARMGALPEQPARRRRPNLKP
jgi:hypothetical protein